MIGREKDTEDTVSLALMKKEERKTPVKVHSLFADIGWGEMSTGMRRATAPSLLLSCPVLAGPASCGKHYIKCCLQAWTLITFP